MYNTFERINGSLATEDRINKNLKLASTLTIKHMGLQPKNSLGWGLGGCVKCLPYKGSILKTVPRDAGEWKLPADKVASSKETSEACDDRSVLSGMHDACIVHLDKCYAGIPSRESREASTLSVRIGVWRTSLPGKPEKN